MTRPRLVKLLNNAGWYVLGIMAGGFGQTLDWNWMWMWLLVVAIWFAEQAAEAAS